MASSSLERTDSLVRPSGRRLALFLPDILLSIFEYLTKEDVASACYVCKAWNYPATLMLWTNHEVPLKALIQILGPLSITYERDHLIPHNANLSEESALCSNFQTVRLHHSAHPIAHEQRNRFIKHANYVRILAVSGHSWEVSPETFVTLKNLHSGGLLFPNIRTVSFCLVSDSSRDLVIDLFFRQRLRSLSCGISPTQYHHFDSDGIAARHSDDSLFPIPLEVVQRIAPRLEELNIIANVGREEFTYSIRASALSPDSKAITTYGSITISTIKDLLYHFMPVQLSMVGASIEHELPFQEQVSEPIMLTELRELFMDFERYGSIVALNNSFFQKTIFPVLESAHLILSDIVSLSSAFFSHLSQTSPLLRRLKISLPNDFLTGGFLSTLRVFTSLIEFEIHQLDYKWSFLERDAFQTCLSFMGRLEVLRLIRDSDNPVRLRASGQRDYIPFTYLFFISTYFPKLQVLEIGVIGSNLSSNLPAPMNDGHKLPPCLSELYLTVTYVEDSDVPLLAHILSFIVPAPTHLTLRMGDLEGVNGDNKWVKELQTKHELTRYQVLEEMAKISRS
ncbi:hypothetical protein FRC02_011371 [Tulasnella sp. 418]|nr:hypothetical protein FRC02_011371 [Tulasnella sp. 418]